ncbi:unnamed protein product [Mycena citricolor]|uniref:P-loop containing nucleoside triphosphate hydrolase protein n=1 Tax=Mycena citricolor TaxID=2018698 RepID=A0AAD2GVA6_9AGAR|nr:unnamed protein product [Mycena citricolor]CAK5263656.1 unnamed protein product [Mycena citricolor]
MSGGGNANEYDLPLRSSIDSEASETDLLIHYPDSPSTPTTTTTPDNEIHATRWLFFSFLSPAQRLALLLPAIALSILAGGVAPLMTVVVGRAFDAFSKFSATSGSSQSNTTADAFDTHANATTPVATPPDVLVHHMSLVALQLLALGFGSFAMSSLTSFLWITTGDHTVLAVRKRVYASIASKSMVWFDTRCSEESEQSTGGDSDGPVGAGGLMAQFSKYARRLAFLKDHADLHARETDEVRESSLAIGRMIEYATTCSICLILALLRSVSLTLVVLSAVPALVIIQAVSQRFSAPLLAIERQQTAVAATLVDRAISPTGIHTVKAFDAAAHEQKALASVMLRIEKAVLKLVALWGLTSGLAQFVMMAMFVQGFWFGARAVRAGRLGAGDVMVVFWACLMATTNLQLCIPQLIVLSKGRFAFQSLLKLLDPSQSIAAHGFVGDVMCVADITMQDISFSYPSRPSIPVLRGATMVFPAHKTTFVVGPSGSGKSTISHLLAGLYAPNEGLISVDDVSVDLRALDIAAVGQGAACALFDMSVHDNVALGRETGLSTRSEVEDVCRQVLMHDFISDLPRGYDTVLGSHGASLSGGQKQRLAIARAMLRDPDVLVLDEATSALDPKSRVLVFDAVRQWRHGRTTIVITHDLAQIEKDDYVYVLKDGCVVESGLRRELEHWVCSVFGTLGHDADFSKHEDDTDTLVDLDTSVAVEAALPLYLTPAPSALTRATRVAELSMNVAAFGWRRTPSPYKPLSAPSTVVARKRNVYTPASKYESYLPIDTTTPTYDAPNQSLSGLLLELYPTVPNKPVLFAGLFACLVSGAMTPIFSFLLARLLFAVATGSSETMSLDTYGLLVLCAALCDGLFLGLKYFLMQITAARWISYIRNLAFGRVLKQDMRWFDRQDSASIGRVLIKDADDARDLLSSVLGQVLVVSAMFGIGMTWAAIAGWQLALAGFVVVPVFGVAMASMASMVARAQLRNKRAGEEVAKRYYEMISSIRGIRAMRLESVFRAEFDKAANRVLSVSRWGAFFEGCTTGLAFGLVYLAEAVLFYFGAILVANGTYSYLQMTQVLNLVVFTVSIGSQLMAFTQRISKSVQAARDLTDLLHLASRTEESQGFLRPELDGTLTFQDVAFSYPARSEVPVLQNVNMEIKAGECVAIVGPSGSGKSTIAALLQRLYEPSFGAVSVGKTPLRSFSIDHLRRQISVVSQQPTLFDASIAENIRYSNEDLPDEEVIRAAQAANIHDFIMGLPQGYDTALGENATLISGGQAQRLQIARALARPSKILILDECTSALDDATQAAIMDTIQAAKTGRTTVMITHKVPVMRMCDRVLVVQKGRIVEDGAFDDLIARRGVFDALLKGL